MFENDYYMIDMSKEGLSPVGEIMEVDCILEDNVMKVKVTYDPAKLLSKMYGGRLIKIFSE